ncbi:MAG: OmpA family protein [Ferruginibacter sp.]|nr:OmpA family protein [Cytophagales bacterium]
MSALLLGAAFFRAWPGLAQVKIDTSRSPDYLVREVLLGDGVWAGNVRYTGAKSALGLFDDQSGILSFRRGILLSTGHVLASQGPNKATDTGYMHRTAGYPGLDSIAKGRTGDAAVLEFDFVPASENLSFHFVFASEEYPEYVGSKYNDAFAFFINGPGLDGPGLDNVNLATLPNSRVPVTVNSINDRKNRKYYLDNPAESIHDPVLYDVRKKKVVRNKRFNKASGLPKYNLQFDGFTTVLKASCRVVPSEVYHLRIAIADVGDFILDSGVYLVANSLRSEGGRPVAIRNPFDVPVAPPQELPAKRDPVSVAEAPLADGFHCTVEFAFDSSELTDEATANVKEAGAYLLQRPGWRAEVIGHTDSVGTDAYNAALSRLRSRTVAHCLTQLGVDPGRLKTEHRGEKEPVTSNQTEPGRARNRRVDIIFRPG